MSAFNLVFTRLVDGFLYPFSGLSPLVGLAVVSALSAIGVLAIIRATSNQLRVAEVKRALHACLLEIRLFRDDPLATFRAVGEIARHQLTYLRLSMWPVLWMALPFGFLLTQLQFHYGYAGLNAEQPALFKVHVKGEAEPDLRLSAPAGIRVETPRIWIPSLREAAWRIVGEQPGDYQITVQVGRETFTKSVRVSDAVVRRSPRRADDGIWNQLLYPVETPLPGGAQIDSIDVTYPRRGIRLFGVEMDWLVVYLGLVTVFVLTLKGRFRVVL